MALSTPTTLTSGGASSAASHTTASVTSETDGLLLLTVHLYASTGSANPTAPAVTGLGRTWTQVGTDILVDDAGSDRGTIFLFRAMGAGATGALTITPPWATKATWILQQILGADTSGTEGSGAIASFVKSQQASVASISTTSPTLSSAESMLYGGLGKQSVDAATWGNGWTKSAEVLTTTITYSGVGYYQGAGQLTQAVTWATAARAGAFAVEVKAAGALGVVTRTVATRWDTYAPAGALPGSIAGVEPETHQHNPVMIVPAGWLYRVVESDTASGNHPVMMKSLDGGSTWAEVDAANRPSARDLEGLHAFLKGSTIVVYITRDDTVWRCQFDTVTDTWGAQETVKTGISASGVEQSTSAVALSNGDEWVAFSNTLSGTNNQAAIAKRTGVNTYGAEIDLGGDTAINWTVPQLALGAAGDVTHIFLKDSTNHFLYWRTLSAAGALSGATRIDSAGTSTDHVSHTNAVVYQSGGQEVIAIAYTDAADILRCVRIVAGAVLAPEVVSSSAILMDPGTVTNGGAVAHLATDGTTLYAAWARADGSVMMRTRTASGWSAESVVVPLTAGATDYACYVYCDVNQYPAALRSGAKVLSIVYDLGEHLADVSDLRYTEVTLTAAAAPVATSRSATWSVRAGVATSRATTWGVRRGVSLTRATNWGVRTGVATTRVTTWGVRKGVTSSRATSWDVAGPPPVSTRFIRQGGAWVPVNLLVRSGSTWV